MRGMLRSRFGGLLLAGLLCFSLAAACSSACAWSNGGYSSNHANPNYGTHDWIAQHALDWLPTQEQQFFTDYLTIYLYGTELPDNPNTPDGIGDTTKHHIYFTANGSLQDGVAAVRAGQEYTNAVEALKQGNVSAAVEHLGMVTHYISDAAVFGHVMSAATAWGSETHHSDYEKYVLNQTDTYEDDFNVYLSFDGSLTVVSAYDAAVAVARDTTFGGASGLSCVWMDNQIDWGNPTFKGRCGESLNLAVNAVADVLHTFYVENVEVPSPTPEESTGLASPTESPSMPEFPAAALVGLAVLVSAAVCLGRKDILKKAK